MSIGTIIIVLILIAMASIALDRIITKIVVKIDEQNKILKDISEKIDRNQKN